MRRQPADVLLAPAFLAALALLLLNDLVLKDMAGNAITGKLSDFAGLFVFPLFWSAFAPRHRAAIHVATALAFTWWKSPLSQSFIDGWNVHAPFAIARTADWTDLVALTAVIAAYRFGGRPRRALPLPAMRLAVVPLALFAFGATSFLSLHRYDRVYRFHESPGAVLEGLDSLGFRPAEPDDDESSLWISLPADRCGGVAARIRLSRDTAGSTLTLMQLSHRCPPARHDSVRLIAAFERCLVQRLDSLLSRGAYVRGLAVSDPGERRTETCGGADAGRPLPFTPDTTRR